MLLQWFLWGLLDDGEDEGKGGLLGRKLVKEVKGVGYWWRCWVIARYDQRVQAPCGTMQKHCRIQVE